jgi:putative endopeptidase
MIQSNYRLSLTILAALILLFPAALSSQPPAGGAARAKATARASATRASSTAGCSDFATEAEGGSGASASAEGPAKHVSGFNLANLDRSVSPCDDFYEFSGGGWMKSHPIPGDHPSFGTFNELRDHNQDVLRQILEDAAKDKSAAPGSNWQKIGDFYASCMDESGIESAGLKPLDAEFQRISDIKDATSLQAEVAALQREGVDAVFGFGSEQDLKNSNLVIAGVGQGGLGLPDRAYYLDDDDRSKQLRAAYVDHVTKMFALMGDDPATAAAHAKVVMDVETQLAKASTKREDLRDPEKNYHPMALKDLDDFTPNFSWDRYFREIGAPSLASADVGQLDFFKEVNAALASVPLSDWKIYLRWHLVHAAVRALPQKFVEENFNFYGKTLTGTKEILPRWRRCVQSTDGELGEALGQYYVQRAFPPEAKAAALAMVNNLRAALRADLATLDWMSPATRQKAIEKLDAMGLKIGYPDKWRDYSNFHVERVAYVTNFLRGDTFEFERDLSKIGKPPDRTEWDMTPATVNAYYNPPMNEIVFPAGILQPPFYDPHASDAINYGGIGSVIGHEMTHGFDDEGAKFDAHGNLNNWWTADDLKNFQARGDCIAAQFSSYQVEPGLNENGKLVEGESIADLGGMTISYAALQKTLEGKPVPAPIDGFTADQLFFLGWGQIWAENVRPEFAQVLTKTDPHPLDQFRTNGPLSNTPAFAKAFGCGADSKMVRSGDQRCRIW